MRDVSGAPHPLPAPLMQFRSSNSRPIVGLDIEPGYVTAAAVHVNGGVSIENAAGIALDTGVVRDGEVAEVDTLAEALRELFRANHLDKRVRVGVANGRIVLRTLELPAGVAGKELAAAVRFQAQEELPMPLDSAVIDFQPIGMVETEEGPRQRVVLVAARRDMVERLIAAVRAAGLRPEGVDLSAFAMIRALAPAADSSDPVLMLSVSGLTNLAVARGPVCQFTRVVSSGLESMALELAERRAITLVEARRELETVGLSGVAAPSESGEDARTLLSEGVRRIATEVRNSLDFYRASEGGDHVSRAILTGAAVAVPGFADALSAELALPVEVGVVGDAAGVGNVAAGRLTVAVGLATEDMRR
jgi:type IV pilus assembly protein PilM